MNTLPIVYIVVSPGSPVSVTVSRLLVLDTLRVVEFIKGIVKVLKKNVVLVVLARMDPGTERSFTTRFDKLLVVDTFIIVEMRLEVLTELETSRLLKSPTLVMLGWAGWLTTRATLAFATLPTILLAWSADRPAPLPATFVMVARPST